MLVLMGTQVGVTESQSQTSTSRDTHQEDDWWVPDERDGGGQLALVAATVCLARPLSVSGQRKLGDRPPDNLVTTRGYVKGPGWFFTF